MTLLRSGFWILALSSIGVAPGFAADAPAHADRGEACDVICDMQAYLTRDHMVAYVEATPPRESAAAKPTRTARKIVKSVPHNAVASRHLASKPMQPMVEPEARQTAQLMPSAPAPSLPAEMTAPARTAQTIPGSAPLVTPQFVPSAGAL